MMLWPSIRISALVRLHQANQVLEKDALAAATSPDDNQGFAGRDFHIYSAQNFLAANPFL